MAVAGLGITLNGRLPETAQLRHEALSASLLRLRSCTDSLQQLVRIEDEAGIAFMDDEAANRALIAMLRSMAELKGFDAGSESPLPANVSVPSRTETESR